MSFRHLLRGPSTSSLLRWSFSPSLSWKRIVLPALAVSIAAAVWARRSRSERPLPRLPVRRQPIASQASVSRADRSRRLQAPAREVVLPVEFWDAEVDDDDPAEVPSEGLSFVSEASRLAAVLDPAEREETGFVLHW